jgi:SAM-dependent methyltransferase
MSYRSIICKMKPYIQPFEKVLALEELSSLAKVQVQPQPSDAAENNLFHISSPVSVETLKRRLAYWETINDGTSELTNQVLTEATANAFKNGNTLSNINCNEAFQNNLQIPVRRSLRYGPHGIHEYRGKFFPQLVRSLANIADIKSGEIVLDPMCGSGTTAVEAILLGCNSLGIDTNPLSVFMSRTKCDILKTNPESLLNNYNRLVIQLYHCQYGSRTNSYNWINRLSTKDKEYLFSWFPIEVLLDLDKIISIINNIELSIIKNLFLLVFSNILRKVSYQKTDDLRVRKEIYDHKINIYSIYLSEIERTIKLLMPFLYQIKRNNKSKAIIIEGDAKKISSYFSDYIGKVKATITSPPYATALPYLDTDRLSLCFFNLISRGEIRKKDYEMIGNREITERIRKNYWEKYQTQKYLFPQEVIDVIDLIDNLNEKSNVGFRRKNLSSLLAKYFADMRDVFIEINKMLSPGAPAYIVIGNNHTIAAMPLT